MYYLLKKLTRVARFDKIKCCLPVSSMGLVISAITAITI